jgi:sec-independent protein translocase protein TatC
MEDRSRPFLEHVDEIRVRLLRALLGLAVGTAAAWPFVDRVLEFLARPVGHFVFLHPTEAFFVRLKIALGIGVLLSAPFTIYQVWKFVTVALQSRERRSIFWVLPASYLLFVAGFFFGFFVLVPAGVQFLLGYGSSVLVAHPPNDRGD